MGKVRDLADKLWAGEMDTADAHPLSTMLGLETYGPGLAFISSFGNVTAIETGEGLVLVDTGSYLTFPHVKSELRGWSSRPVHTVVYTHGHVDHVGGVKGLLKDQEQPARVLAHRALPARLDRYRDTAGYNSVINARQFRMPGLRWPTEYRYPDTVYEEELGLRVGDEELLLRHDRGETDDSTWVWLPSRRVLCTGDLFIWAAPNCGNPQKVQRYPKEWAAALRRMAELRPTILLPGHGPPIEGQERIQEALLTSADLLTFLVRETLARMNEGLPLDRILREVQAPEELLSRPYLRPIYDEPEFIVRNLWRLYGGWYDGDPAHLKPAPGDAVAAEVAALAGGAAALARRATELSDEGDHRLACQLVEWAYRADPKVARSARRRIYRRRVDSELSFMAKSIYQAAADE